MPEKPKPPFLWLQRVEMAGQRLKSVTRWQAKEWLRSANGMNTTRRVYAILLYDPNRDSDPFGVYVGMTRYRPPERYKQHKQGTGNVIVQNSGVQLLPYVYRHLNPMIPSEAKWMEHQLYLAIKNEIPWVSMGV
jgi:hypothetical protein